MADNARDTSFIRASALSGFAEFVASQGRDPIELLTRVGIDPNVLTSPDMLVSFVRKGVLLETAAQELGIPSFGLGWVLGIRPYFPNFGPMLLLAEATATFGEWIERSARYWRFHTNAIVLQVIRAPAPETIAIRIIPTELTPVPRQHMEHIAGKIVRLIRAVVADGDLNPVQVRFRHLRPADTALHEVVFRCPLEFGAGQDEILLMRDILAKPLGGREVPLEVVVEEFLRYRIGMLRRYTPGVSTSTALTIKTVLGVGICSKVFVANALGLSPRKLQRLLAREETTYEEVLDVVRMEMACELLSGATAPISAIAGMLDFSSSAALTLAVRRWTGMTPSSYRASARRGPEPILLV